MPRVRMVVPLLLAVLVLPLFGASNGSVQPANTAVDVSEFGALGSIDGSRISRRIGAEATASRDGWGERAETFIRGYAARRGAAGNESFETRRTIKDEIGQVHVRMSQSIAGLPVVGAELILHADAKSGKVIGVNGRFIADRDLPRQPKVGADAAIDYATGEYGIDASLVVGVPELTYIATDRGAVHLAWTNLVSHRDEEGEQLDRIYADALTGEPIARHPQVHRAKSRQVYDCANTTTVPGTPQTCPGSCDATEVAVYNNMGIVWDYWSAQHGRDSYNNAGATIKANVHYDVNSHEGSWSAANGMLFGDGGSGGYTAPLGNSLDVVAHEFGHGVTENVVSGGLTYLNESGALNESMSDVFAAAAEAYSDGSVNADVWTIADEVRGSPLRTMNDPEDSGDSDYYPFRYIGASDFGGVHTNSGIQNLAFYLLVAGGQHPDGDTSISVSSIGLASAEAIFFRALDVYTTSSTNFRLMREHTLQAATDLYGVTEHTAVANAWAAVGNNWQNHSGTISTPGNSATTTPYTLSSVPYHTGQLFGPGGANFDLYLERKIAGVWTTQASSTSMSTNEVIEYPAAASGEYRWRIHAASGTGAYSLKTNVLQ